MKIEDIYDDRLLEGLSDIGICEICKKPIAFVQCSDKSYYKALSLDEITHKDCLPNCEIEL